MLYNSFTFLLFFTLVLLVYYLYALPKGGKAPAWVLLAASLYFYGQYSLPFLGLLMGSIVVSFAVCKQMLAQAAHPGRKKALLWIGVGLNILSLGYFKYYLFIAGNLQLIGIDAPVYAIALPLGISFYTFQQIAYIVDTYKSNECNESLLEYLLFITYFPRLISGPIVRRQEVMPYFAAPERDRATYIKVGLTLFILGMGKKLLIADSFAVWADLIFNAADAGKSLTSFEAWAGALAYTIQIYFDFSGYSDMAVGVSTMLGVPLPVNFASPYKSTSITDFWRRWHITLSKWLRDYVYIPLGGNRCSSTRRYLNALLTMLVGGIWHGASWNFILWGAMHGCLQAVHNMWHAKAERKSIIPHSVAVIITFFCIVMTWIPFRANTWDGAMRVFQACFSLSADVGSRLTDPFNVIFWLAVGLLIVRFAPNTNEILANTVIFTPSKGYPATQPDPPAGNWAFLRWRDNHLWAIIIGSIFALCVMRFFSNATYIYFQF